MVNSSVVNVWTWIDAVQMAMPVFIQMGVLLSDNRYFDKAWALYAHTRDTEGGGLLNEADGLWWRDARYSPGGTRQMLTATLNNPANFPATSASTYIVAPSGQEIYWSRGNGWVIAALTRVLDILPQTDGHRAQYLADFRAMAAALVTRQRSDGFWNENLADPTHCQSIGVAGQDGPESSGTALFVYGLAWGIRTGVLSEATYGPVVIRAWNGLTGIALQSSGLLGYIQSTGNRPCQRESDDPGLGATIIPNFDDFGVGCFLLAGSEVAKLAAR